MGGGVLVLGMHRSGTSAATRLVSFLGAMPPHEADLVPPSRKNPAGYWESMSLVNLNNRVLAAVGSNERCPPTLAAGWERDPSLDRLRAEAPGAVRAAFPTPPWAWKDPRHCLVLSFWRDVLGPQPVILVHRNPLEIVASALRLRPDEGRVYALALWERYLREGLRQLAGLPVFVTRYEDLVSAPLEWVEDVRVFLDGAGIPLHDPDEREIDGFVDAALRHVSHTEAEVAGDPDLSDAQRALHRALEGLVGRHAAFVAPVLPPETPSTDALLEERRRALRIRWELEGLLEEERRSRFGARVRRARPLAPARLVWSVARSRWIAREARGDGGASSA